MKKFRPEVENLTDRVVPATVSIVGNALVIQGTSDNDVAAVIDDGSDFAGNLRGVVNGVGIGTLTAGQSRLVNIDTINFIGRNGDDSFRYRLAGPMFTFRTLYAGQGGGNDFFSANLGNFPGAGLGFGSVFNITVAGQNGNDTTFTSLNGGIGGTLTQVIDGGTGEDVTSTFFGGTLAGTIDNTLIAGDGGDVVRATAGLAAGSTGVLNANINVEGNDGVDFNLFDAGSFAVTNLVLDANDGDVTLYSAVIGFPILNTTFLNAENLQEVVVA